MQRRVYAQRFLSIPDAVVFLLVATAIYGVVAIGNEWRSEFHPLTQIDLSVWSLPYYTLMSGIRGAVAYLISLIFTLIVGYIAAKSKTAEKIIVPLLDILQSIPVLGFLPGLIIGLVALFPHTNTGLELAAIIMIFTGQVWNMTFSYYSSLKSIPNDFHEASTIMGLSWNQKLLHVELPFSAVNLVWNSLLSMAGGWFFLIPCEAMTLGDQEYRLPGIGAYMDVAIKTSDHYAIVMAIIAMVLLIVMMDLVIWRPILAWVQKFRLESVPGASPEEPIMQIWIREAKSLRLLKLLYRQWLFKRRTKRASDLLQEQGLSDSKVEGLGRTFFPDACSAVVAFSKKVYSPKWIKALGLGAEALALACLGFGAYKLLMILCDLSLLKWFILMKNTAWTFLRVVVALLISTLWAVPVGIWLGTNAKRVRVAQPIIQIMASFPAPMLYPIALACLFGLKMSFDWAAMCLMLLGVQWYVLFNVLAGALRIPNQLIDAASLMNLSRWEQWKTLYLPSVFPSLVTGWITAAGGAWNASVVAEYIFYQGAILKTKGLGATLSVATSSGDFTLFAASLTVMVLVVVTLNRVFWSRLYYLAQTRFRMDL